MVVLKTEPWSESRPATSSNTKTLEMFGFQDLASDYYQVLREKDRPAWCRFVWSVVIILLMLFTGYMVYQLLSDYFQYNSFNESSTIWQKNLTLPAITICNTNPINYTTLEQELAKADLQHEFEHLMGDFINLSTEPGAAKGILKHPEFANFVNWEIEEGSLVLKYKAHLYDTLIGEYDYVFGGVGHFIDHSDYHKYSQLTELGVCFEINDDGSLQQSSGGVRGGLTIDLDANINDYLFTTATKGFVVFIRDQDETIMLNKGGYIVPPGSEAFLKLNVRSLTRLGEPHGTCKNVDSQFAKYSHHFETVRECVQRQNLEAMVTLCRCIPWYLADRLYTLNKTDTLDAYTEHVKYLNNGTATITVDEPTTQDIPDQKQTEERKPLHRTRYSEWVCGFVEMYSCHMLLDTALLDGKIELEPCPEPCEYHEWDVEIATTVFPSTTKYFDRFIKEQVYMAEPPSFEYARENMARIHIYYDQMKVDKLVQTKAYEPQNFIAEFGGTVDLFIGFSFFTIFQLIEIALAICVTKCWRYRNRKKLNARQDHVLNNPNAV